MKKKPIVLVTLTLLAIITLSACEDKQKTTVIANDIKQETAMQEDEVKKIIMDGASFLNEGKYEDAKSTFEKAISMDKANKGAYIEIKNKYMEKQRIDDAYGIIKTAINNNVDTENMKEILKDIKSKFEDIKLDISLYENSEYQLPTKVKTKINNEDKELNVVWSNNTIDTSKIGKVKYEGKIEQYDRNVELNLNIMEIKRERKIGFISKVYEQGGVRYITIDEIEFYFNEENNRIADIEAAKDGFKAEDGVYYIRNNSRTLKNIQLSPNAIISLCGHRFELDTLYQNPISYDKFKELKQKSEYFLCNVNLENDVVVRIEEQYTP
ncbi:hypothetical protein SDC9_96998 [bioreactor metagenome]|uniref:Bacterial Ig-like domain-containing protein n=1 Tax=bioreactor metagenome TaxID=1076179 RepID=A0A645AAQ5_9ZZZZ